MTKPIVFLSHSSQDASIVRSIKDLLQEKTNGTVDFFMSSDGESIRLGSNWVSSLEEALKACSLMFVFVSTRSVTSQWIYFEAGHAYSRGIRVVPVAIPGVHLKTLSPPISLLQGFDLTSGSRLDNFLDEINRSYNHAHKLTCTNEDYRKLLRPPPRPVHVVPVYTQWIETVKIKTSIPFETALPRIREVYRANQIDVQTDDFELLSYGATYRGEPLLIRGDEEERSAPLSIDFDPAGLPDHFRILSEVISGIPSDTTPSVNVTLYFASQVGCIRQRHKMTARLPGSGISFGPSRDLVHEGMSLWIDYGSAYQIVDDISTDRVKISLHVPPDRLIDINLQALLRILFERNILFFYQ